MKFIKKVLFIMIIVISLCYSRVFGNTGTINVSATRLRQEPNTTSEILTNIYEDESVDIVGEEGEWYKVNYNNKTGFVKKEFVKVSKSSSSNNSNTSANNEINNNQADSKNTNQTINNETTNNQTATNNNNNQTNTTNNSETNTAVTNNIQNNETENTTKENTAIDSNKTSDNNESKEISQITITVQTDLRVLPSFVSKKIGTLESGKSFEKISEMNNWVQVSDNSIVGWVPKTKTSLENTEELPQNDNTNTTNTNENTTNEVESSSTTNSVANETNTVKEENRNDTNTSNSVVGKTGKVNVETARVRETASTSAEIIDGLDYGTSVNIVAEEGDWYKIKAGNVEGFISKKLVTVSDNNTTSRSLPDVRNVQTVDGSTINPEQNNEVNKMLSSATPLSSRGGEVVETAKQYLGYSYVSGGKSPQTGFDCSGFTRFVYSNFGYSLGGSAASQISSGTEVSKDNLQAGDLILFYDEGRTKVGHTGIYMGNGNFIHAANSSRGVVTDNLNTSSYYNTRFVAARRIVE